MAGRHHRFRVTTFVLIGSGWRARMVLKVARELGTVRCAGVVVRTEPPGGTRKERTDTRIYDNGLSL
jgi:hypothetical protein